MKQIGVRELRQNASKWLREVEGGEIIEITDRGRPVAKLVPIEPMSVLERLVAEGRARPARGNLLDHWPPRVAPRPGVPLPSEILEQLRADER